MGMMFCAKSACFSCMNSYLLVSTSCTEAFEKGISARIHSHAKPNARRLI